MLYEVEGDLVQDEQFNIICHQANCLGAMGAGIAKQIALKYPSVQVRNKDKCSKENPLGSILVVKVGPQRFCVNLYGQYNYGRKYLTYTNYDALQKAMDELAERLNKSNIPDDWKIAFPYRMACGLANGSWKTVYGMISDFADKVYQDVYIVHRKESE